MFCTKCGKEIINGVCPNCGQVNAVNGETVATDTINAETAAPSADTSIQFAEGKIVIGGAPTSAQPPLQGQGQMPYQQPQQASYQESYQQPVADDSLEYENAVYQASAKKHWYCYLVPLLFFIPVLNNGKADPGNLDVANNTLWLFILEVGATLIRRILSSLGLSLLSGVFGVLSTLVSIFTLAAFICAVSGNAFKIPKLEKIKIIK